VYQGFFPW